MQSAPSPSPSSFVPPLSPSSSQNYQILRDETKELHKASTFLYHQIIFGCQKKCLSFEQGDVQESENQCLKKCANESMFFDNMVFEFDSILARAQEEDKPKKAYFYFARRIDDLTSQ